ncbi:MAG: hypothetical protein QOG06_996 [Gaiellaceae bacterium]|nr:hypothetical protein [Gaiellaceae bacterium]
MTVTRLTRAERRAQTRQALLDAAAELVAERGFHAASVELIAQRAGYTRGAFYSNFSSKEELFAELLQQRVYSIYAGMIADDDGPRGRAAGEALAAVQAHPEGRWMFVLWLELLAQAGREDGFRELAADFWRANRARLTELTRDEVLSSLAIAIDIGLAIQHYVDPEGAPLSLYPDVFERLEQLGL